MFKKIITLLSVYIKDLNGNHDFNNGNGVKNVVVGCICSSCVIWNKYSFNRINDVK